MGFSRGMIASGAAALALVVGGCKSGPAASTPTQAGTTTGVVVSAKYDAVVLKEQGSDKHLRLVVDPATQVVVEGRIVMVERLPEGTLVRASYDASGRASRIEELPKGGAAASGGGESATASASETAAAEKK